jgi:hypothetical protein
VVDAAVAEVALVLTVVAVQATVEEVEVAVLATVEGVEVADFKEMKEEAFEEGAAEVAAVLPPKFIRQFAMHLHSVGTP